DLGFCVLGQRNQTIVKCVTTVHHGWPLRFFIDEEVEIMPDQFHLAQSIIDAHWRCSVLLRTHYLTWALVLNGFCVWVNQAVFARLCTCCLCVSNDFSSEFSSALACTVTGLGSFTAHFILAQRTFHLLTCCFYRSVKVFFLCFCTGNVSLASGGNLNALCLRVTARI